MRTLLIACLLVAIGACHKPAEQTDHNAPTAEAGPVKGVDRSHKGKPAPDVAFKNSDGEDVRLADLSGKPMLVNLWATWCAPCVKELPTLDRLAQKGGPVEIVAISQDSAPHASVVAFLQAHRIGALDVYQDEKMGLSGAAGAEVLPTSILYDAKGREIWRYVGDLDWTSPEAARLLAEAAAPAKG
jgi:thiol-disulfide isomerase/thioredoxin